MAMTKKYYELVAQIVKELHLGVDMSIDSERELRTIIAYKFADAFSLDNDKFNKVKFLKGCGL